MVDGEKAVEPEAALSLPYSAGDIMAPSVARTARAHRSAARVGRPSRRSLLRADSSRHLSHSPPFAILTALTGISLLAPPPVVGHAPDNAACSGEVGVAAPVACEPRVTSSHFSSSLAV